jgi:hypothetical protein
MSLLGFDALGRFAIGQISSLPTVVVLPASTGSCIVAGLDANFFRDFEAWLPGQFATPGWVTCGVQDEAWSPSIIQPDPWTI